MEGGVNDWMGEWTGGWVGVCVMYPTEEVELVHLPVVVPVHAAQVPPGLGLEEGVNPVLAILGGVDEVGGDDVHGVAHGEDGQGEVEDGNDVGLFVLLCLFGVVGGRVGCETGKNEGNEEIRTTHPPVVYLYSRRDECRRIL